MLLNGLLLTFIFEYVKPGNLLPVLDTLKIGSILPLLVVIFALFKSKPVSNIDLLKLPTSKWMIFWLILLGVSVMTADVTLYAYNVFYAVFGRILMYLMIIKIVTDRTSFKKLIAVLLWSHVIVILLTPDLILRPEVRSYIAGGSFLGDGNDFSLSAVIAFPLGLWLAQDAKQKIGKLVYYGASGFLILAVIGTQSRGGTLALLAVFGFLWLKSKKKALGLIALVLVAISAISFAPDIYFERMRSISDYQTEGSAKGRIMAWKSATRMATDHPLTGVGAGHFPSKFGTEYRPPELGETRLWLTAHSSYFLVLGELGFPGLICVLALLWGCFKRNSRALKSFYDRGETQNYFDPNLFVALNASLIGLAVGGAFLSATYYPHIFVVCGLHGAAVLMQQDDIRKYIISGHAARESKP